MTWGRTGSIPACAGEPRSFLWARPRSRVYPRVCGGTGMLALATRTGDGLSPRVRGNRHRSRHGRQAPRSIPACAGEPSALTPCPRCGRVYPRVCGGTVVAHREVGAVVGLSPRVRGNLPAGLRGAVPPRSIPACAGEPSGLSCAVSGAKVYPRVCGGTRPDLRVGAAQQGLSPRVRGNPTATLTARQWTRSIPACAGEPRGAHFRERLRPVYPRVCGGTRHRH